MGSRCFVVDGAAVGARCRGLAVGVAALGLGSAAQAHLGGFEAADGYQPFLNMVQNYNAGQYGPSSGYVAMSPAAITPNTGLWRAINGGFQSGSQVSYVTGHQNVDRQWVNSGIGAASNQGLVLTTGHEGWSGPALRYEYDLDSSDLGGIAPAATGSASIKTSFWVKGALAGPEMGGMVAEGYFGNEIAFIDSLGVAGFRAGLTQHATGDLVTYWDGTSMVEAAIASGGGFYDRWDITIDLASDTFSASFFQFLTSTTHNLVTGAPLMGGMNDLTTLNFRSSPGVNNSKLWSVDDFGFEVRPVPGPGALALGVVAAGLVGLRRRR